MTEYIVKCNEFTTAIGNKLQFPDYIDYSHEVVRCRDCKRWHDDDCDWNPPDLEQPDGFCAWGERKAAIE